MRKLTGLFILTAITTSCSSSTGGSPSGVVRSLETTVSPVSNNATWPATFDPDRSASLTEGAVTVVGYLPFDQCRFTTDSDHRVLGGSVFVTLASKAFPERLCMMVVAETRYVVTLTGLPAGAHQLFVIENPALRWDGTAWVSSVDTIPVGSITVP